MTQATTTITRLKIENLLTSFLQKLTDDGRVNDPLIRVFCEFELRHSTTISRCLTRKTIITSQTPDFLPSRGQKIPEETAPPGKNRRGHLLYKVYWSDAVSSPGSRRMGSGAWKKFSL